MMSNRRVIRNICLQIMSLPHSSSENRPLFRVAGTAFDDRPPPSPSLPPILLINISLNLLYLPLSILYAKK